MGVLVSVVGGGDVQLGAELGLPLGLHLRADPRGSQRPQGEAEEEGDGNQMKGIHMTTERLERVHRLSANFGPPVSFACVALEALDFKGWPWYAGACFGVALSVVALRSGRELARREKVERAVERKRNDEEHAEQARRLEEAKRAPARWG